MMLAALAAAAFAAQDSARLTLLQAVDRALATYPSVAAARAQRDHVAADLGEAQSGRLPRLMFDGALNRFQEPMVVLPLHSFDPRTPPIFDRTLLQTGLSVSWTVFDFGGRSARVGAQRALGDAASAAVSSAEMQLLAGVANAYLRVLTARGVLAAQDQRLQALHAASDRTRQLVAQGKAARVDGLRVEAEERRAIADRIGSAAQLDVAEHALALFAQVPYDAVHASALSALQPPPSDTGVIADSAAARSAVVERARQFSTDVREAEDRRRAARAGLSAARATWLPEIRLSGAYVDRGRWWGDFSAEWQGGVSLSYPLYTGGSRESATRRAAADDRAAGEQVRAAEFRVEQGVDQALAALREAHARVAALQSALDQSAEVARIERLSLDVGSGTQTDYLTAEANLLAVRASLVQARHAELSARVELARVTGVLSRDWLASLVESPR
jgi:outer membrane protein TolC